MTDAPEQLLSMVAEAASAHPDSVEDALNVLINRWARCPARRTWSEELETRAMREMLHRYRHQRNVQLRRQWGVYGTAAKVGLGTGAANRVAEMLLLDSYSISGHILGNILFDEIDTLANSEREKAEGSLFNESLLRSLKRGGRNGQLVREFVTERRLRNLFKSLGRNTDTVEVA